MKIGIICEGEKTDVPVVKLIFNHYFDQQIANSQAEFEYRGVDKATIFSAGDVLLKDMFDRGIKRVLIIWDLLPVGQQMAVPSQYNERPNREEQRKVLLETLFTSPHLPPHWSEHIRYLRYRYRFAEDETEIVAPARHEYVSLVCVCFTLETWLIADPDLLRQLASTPRRAASEFGNHRFDECSDPGVQLSKYFGRNPNPRLKYYNKIQGHNEVIARAYCVNNKLHRMRDCSSFDRVIKTIEGWLSG